MVRDREAASLLWETLPEEVLDSIEAVCMDMSGIDHQVATEMVPQAAIVHDRSHVSKLVNEALDQVRRAENKVLSADRDDRLKGSRHLFLCNLENLPKDRFDEFEQLRNLFGFPLELSDEAKNSRPQSHKDPVRRNIQSN